jgi:hypothetical protein
MTNNPGLSSQQPDETLAEFLDRRERELTHRLAALQGEMTPIEAELAQIRRAKTAVQTLPTFNALAGTGYAGPLMNFLSAGNRKKSSAELAAETLAGQAGRYLHMTIKELIVRALLDNFREGASPAQLREFIRDAYGREIDRSSLSPQLSRLKAAGVVTQPNALADIWALGSGSPFTSVEERLRAIEADDASND